MFPQKPLDSTKVIPLVGSVFATESEIFGLLGSLSHDFLALTLESEIDVAPSPSEKFNLRILISIKAMWPFFNFFPSIFFQKLINVPIGLFWTLCRPKCVSCALQ